MNLDQSRAKVLDDIESLHRVGNRLNELQNELEKGQQERLEQGDCFSIANDCSSPKNDKNKSPGPSIKMVTIVSGNSSPTSSSSSSNSPVSDTDQNKQSISQHLINRHRPKYQTNKDEITHYRFHQLEEELKVTRERLIRAENSLAIKKWSAPHQLQLWLQLTYELELANCIAKRQAAEAQLIAAKDGCDKLRRKRSSFLGSFRVAHGSSIDDVDGKIVQAKRALSEVTKELKERLHRWQQIENLCGFNIVSNKGLPHIQAELFAGGSNSHSTNELADLSGASDVDTTASGTGMTHEIEANDYSDVFGLHRTSSFARSSFRRSIRSNHSFDRSACLEPPSSPRHLTSNKKDDDGQDSTGFGDYNLGTFDFRSNQNVSHYPTINCSLMSPDNSITINPPLLSPRHRRTWSSIRRHPRRRNPPSTDPQFDGRTLGSEKSFSLSLLGTEFSETARTSSRLTRNKPIGQGIPSRIVRKPPSRSDQHSFECEPNPSAIRATDPSIKSDQVDETILVGSENDMTFNTEQLVLNDINPGQGSYAKKEENQDETDKLKDKIFKSHELHPKSGKNQVFADNKMDCIKILESQLEQEALASTSQNLSRSEPCVSNENSDDAIDSDHLKSSGEKERPSIDGNDPNKTEILGPNSLSHSREKTKKVWLDYLRSARKPLAFLAFFTHKKIRKS